MKVWFTYAAVAVVVALVGGLGASLALGPDATRAVWFAAGVALLLQLVAFAALVAVRDNTQLFMAGWLVGLVLRFGAVGVTALWLRRDPVLDPEVALVSLVAFVFVLLLMEPVFLRRGLQTR